MDFTRFKTTYHIRLDPQQEEAVQAVEGQVLLLAVPGSGKTTVLVTRLGYMLHGVGIPPEHILTMTYTVSAARDMKARYAALFGGEEKLAFHTINAVCARIIRYYERVFDRSAFRLLEDGGGKNALLGELYKAQTGEFATEGILKNLQSAITYAKNQMLTGENLEGMEVEGMEFAPFFQAYNQALRQRRQMDFDDQMVYALQILRKYPQVLAAIRKRYRYFCVDEAQDTSRIQHTIIRLLAGEGGNLFMVGDEDQSIYGFRAACPQALTEFDRVYPNARVLFLERNYRSTRPIVEAAAQFIQKNRDRRPKRMVATQGDGPAVREIPVYDRQSQYHYLCKAAADCSVETAVLYRDNDSALPLIDLLDREGIPYRCRQMDGSFFTSRVVRDLTDLIRLAQDPNDGERFLSLYYKLGAGISKAMAQEAVRLAEGRGLTPLEYLISSPKTSPWTKRQCKALQTHLRGLLTDPGDKAVYRMVHFMGYGDYLQERGGDLHKAEILEALGAAQPGPAALLARLEALEQVARQGSGAADCPFILSTIHSSKGLEYQRVLLLDVADGIFPRSVPGGNAGEEERELYEEERRLFYVGMTRAKGSLGVFTFRKGGFFSTFARELFPQKAPEGKKVRPARPLSRPGREEVETRQAGYTPGVRLVHKAFGPGVVTARTGDIATIAFDSGADKRLSLSTALRMGQLALE
ncbi:ATP-dependent helicase [Pseudoflavonifractor phocaeensis]|uniref:ATP-dependent helicase n=1 Tax=Pseudoflavonifractor phocaeensis TaxID=1870988 RepID=UPI00195EFDF1|nr:ATP-dependent helicase [Pseudoflavonifractor phocaeensis]MBM6927353.1 ATP-dependent helicase [Pseudoflavonifractor phocaeensis]